MSGTRTAVVLGASGSVGKALVAALMNSRAFHLIVTLVRQSQPDQLALAKAVGVELREVFLPMMQPTHLEEATKAAIEATTGEVVGLSVLGVGANTAKLTIDQHRAVDVLLNAAFAKALRASARVTHLAFMSAVGADHTATTTGSGAAGLPRYARVKGEAEQAVTASGPPVVSIFRPAMIIGSKHTPWLLERIIPWFSLVTPKRYLSISVQEIAKAMVATSTSIPVKSAIYHYPEMVARAG